MTGLGEVNKGGMAEGVRPRTIVSRMDRWSEENGFNPIYNAK